MSLTDKYNALCEEHKIKANSSVLKQLNLAEANPESFTEWSLKGNVIGVKGCTAICTLIKQAMPQLETLSLSGNNLASNNTDDLLREFLEHPSLSKLDLSNNDIRLGGPSLVELVKKNKKLIEVNIDGTYLRPLFERLIGIHVKKNLEATGASQKVETKSARRGVGFAASNVAENEENPFSTEDKPFASEESAADGDQQENSVEAFGNFSQVKFDSGADGGKKVARRATVCSGAMNEEDIDNFEPDVIEKEEETRQWLKDVLEKHNLFSHLEEDELFIVIDAFMEVEKAEGDTIFEQGDEEGDLFYVIGKGQVRLTKEGEQVAMLSEGDTTQDLMLMYSTEYPETATCMEDTTIFSLDRKTYRCAVAKASKKKRALYEGFLSNIKFLQGLSKQEMLNLADALKSVNYNDGEYMIKHGDDGTAFFIIVEGTIGVIGRNEKDEKVEVCEFSVGANIGELEFLNNHKCVADCLAKGPVRAAKMNRYHFEMVMGPVKEVLQRTAAESTVYSYYRDTLDRMANSK